MPTPKRTVKSRRSRRQEAPPASGQLTAPPETPVTSAAVEERARVTAIRGPATAVQAPGHLAFADECCSKVVAILLEVLKTVGQHPQQPPQQIQPAPPPPQLAWAELMTHTQDDNKDGNTA